MGFSKHIFWNWSQKSWWNFRSFNPITTYLQVLLCIDLLWTEEWKSISVINYWSTHSGLIYCKSTNSLSDQTVRNFKVIWYCELVTYSLYVRTCPLLIIKTQALRNPWIFLLTVPVLGLEKSSEMFLYRFLEMYCDIYVQFTRL